MDSGIPTATPRHLLEWLDPTFEACVSDLETWLEVYRLGLFRWTPPLERAA
jgi:hypothetical protein